MAAGRGALPRPVWEGPGPVGGPAPGWLHRGAAAGVGGQHRGLPGMLRPGRTDVMGCACCEAAVCSDDMEPVLCMGLAASGLTVALRAVAPCACRNTFTAVGHVITAVIGAGVLSLPYTMSILGWVAGPICLLIFSAITLYTSQLLADCYIIDGRRQRTYTDVVHTTFGRVGYITLGCIQHSNLFLTALAYQITATLSLQ